jgi:hypothetical protein
VHEVGGSVDSYKSGRFYAENSIDWRMVGWQCLLYEAPGSTKESKTFEVKYELQVRLHREMTRLNHQRDVTIILTRIMSLRVIQVRFMQWNSLIMASYLLPVHLTKLFAFGIRFRGKRKWVLDTCDCYVFIMANSSIVEEDHVLKVTFVEYFRLILEYRFFNAAVWWIWSDMQNMGHWIWYIVRKLGDKGLRPMSWMGLC